MDKAKSDELVLMGTSSKFRITKKTLPDTLYCLGEVLSRFAGSTVTITVTKGGIREFKRYLKDFYLEELNNGR